jgi:hypothetical protein
MNFEYWAYPETYTSRRVPYMQGVQEHQFYAHAGTLPEGVPSECNPRKYNIDRKDYQPVHASFCMQKGRRIDADLFHIKNRGIIVLSNRVFPQWDQSGWVRVHADIPSDLGNIDGNHSYQIVLKHKKTNPDQLIGVRVFTCAHWTPELVNYLAQALNMGVDLTNGDMGNAQGRFDDIKTAIQGQPYENWIAWQTNEPYKSVDTKTIVSLLWACNPLLYKSSAKQPTWIYTRAQSVFTNGFYGNDSIFNEMIKLSPLMPDIIDLFIHINEHAIEVASKRGNKGLVPAERSKELSIRSLCLPSGRIAFREPPISKDTNKVWVLRECYLLIYLSALREFIVTDAEGNLKWRHPWRKLREALVDKDVMKKTLDLMVRRLRGDRGQHDITQRQPELWDLVSVSLSKWVSETMAKN